MLRLPQSALLSLVYLVSCVLSFYVLVFWRMDDVDVLFFTR